MTSDSAISRPQVFGFLLGIDFTGMSGPGEEKDGDQTRDIPPPSSAGGAQSESKQAEQEEEEVHIVGVPPVRLLPGYPAGLPGRVLPATRSGSDPKPAGFLGPGTRVLV